MNQEYTNANRLYGSYEGNSDYYTRSKEEAAQKLHVDSDEQFADLLVRRIKRELLEELKQTANSNNTTTSGANGVPIINIGMHQTGEAAKDKDSTTSRSIPFAFFATVTSILMAILTLVLSVFAGSYALLVIGFMSILYVLILFASFSVSRR